MHHLLLHLSNHNNNYLYTDYINITIQPSRIVAAEGESISISITAEGPGKENFGYRWRRRDSVPLSNISRGTNTVNLTISSVTLYDSGEYYCFVINQWGHPVDSDHTAVTILSKYR